MRGNWLRSLFEDRSSLVQLNHKFGTHFGVSLDTHLSWLFMLFLYDIDKTKAIISLSGTIENIKLGVHISAKEPYFFPI